MHNFDSIPIEEIIKIWVSKKSTVFILFLTPKHKASENLYNIRWFGEILRIFLKNKVFFLSFVVFILITCNSYKKYVLLKAFKLK